MIFTWEKNKPSRITSCLYSPSVDSDLFLEREAESTMHVSVLNNLAWDLFVLLFYNVITIPFHYVGKANASHHILGPILKGSFLHCQAPQRTQFSRDILDFSVSFPIKVLLHLATIRKVVGQGWMFFWEWPTVITAYVQFSCYMLQKPYSYITYT